MDINLNTPALLFPGITLLMLAYTNRFLALANLVRRLHEEYKKGKVHPTLLAQIASLRRRINLIRYMQALGILSFLGCVACMYALYREALDAAEWIFAISLLSLIASLVLSLVEITQSTKAIELELSDIEELERSNIFYDMVTDRSEKKDQAL